MRVTSQRGQKTNNHNILNEDDDFFKPKKSKKIERKSEKRKQNQRFQNLIKQGIYDIEEDMD